MDFQDQDREKVLMQSEDKYFFIRSLAKGLHLLELLSDNEALTVTQIAKMMNINRAGSHRFLSTLKEINPQILIGFIVISVHYFDLLVQHPLLQVFPTSPSSSSSVLPTRTSNVNKTRP